ncbi:MAG: rod shape-determining protein MreC [Treponema sp.]|nr:rod shape-determining protein MreC [Treponema sp.]
MKKRGGTSSGTPAVKKRLGPESYVFIALMLISFSMLFVSTRDLMFNFRDAGLTMFSGVRGGVSEVSSFVTNTVLFMQELTKARDEITELREQLIRYEQLERSSAEINEENRRLREQLAFSQELDYSHIPAKLIGRDPDNLYSALVINKGRHSGVSRDMAVIAWHGGTQALVGKVIEARRFDSLVMPLYDASLHIASRFAASRYEGIVEGQGNPDTPVRMRYIPKRAMDEISQGDMVITSGMGAVYPPGINIGRVTNVAYHEYEITMEVEIEPLIDFSRLEYVFVLELMYPLLEDDLQPDSPEEVSQ